MSFLHLGKRDREIPSNILKNQFHSLLKITCKSPLIKEAGLCWLVEANSHQVLWATKKQFLQEASHKMKQERSVDLMTLFPQAAQGNVS